MKKIIRNVTILIICCLIFFLVLPMFNPEAKTEKKEKRLELYGDKLKEPIEDANHIALSGIKMSFPISISELPEVFHIEDMYYDEMTDGIDAGDYFHCNLLNEENEKVAYIRVSNLKQNRVDSPEEMTVTYIEADSFQHDGKEYAVPFEVMGGIGIGSSYKEVKEIFPEIVIDEKAGYSIAITKIGIQTITLEFINQKIYKMSVEVY